MFSDQNRINPAYGQPQDQSYTPPTSQSSSGKDPAPPQQASSRPLPPATERGESGNEKVLRLSQQQTAPYTVSPLSGKDWSAAIQGIRARSTDEDTLRMLEAMEKIPQGEGCIRLGYKGEKDYVGLLMLTKPFRAPPFLEGLVALPGYGAGKKLTKVAVQISESEGQGGKLKLRAHNDRAHSIFEHWGFRGMGELFMNLDPNTAVRIVKEGKGMPQLQKIWEKDSKGEWDFAANK